MNSAGTSPGSSSRILVESMRPPLTAILSPRRSLRLCCLPQRCGILFRKTLYTRRDRRSGTRLASADPPHDAARDGADSASARTGGAAYLGGHFHSFGEYDVHT